MVETNTEDVPHSHLMPALTEIRVRNAKSRERPYKLFDELGLFLLITPSATQHKGRLWRLRYRYGDAEKLFSLGAYPAVSLKRAREKRDEARRQLADGVDPSVHRKIAEESRAETFEVIAREWLSIRAKTTAAVNKAQRLAERRKMMQTWADHLDCLRTGKDIDIPTSST